ncbi:MAG: adenosine deaminase [Leptonema sp. (in: bacteria)]
MPKTEIHLHIEACISKETIIKILQEHKENFDVEEIEKLYQFKNLNEFIKLFLFILDSIKKPEDFQFIFENLKHYLIQNNIRYAEVFYAPSRLIQNGLEFREIARTLDYLAKECVLDGGPEVKFLVDVSRTFGPENASKNLKRLLEAKVDTHIGIGLGGAELMGPARDFKDIFAQARAEGLHCVAHSGEDDGPWSIWDTVQILKAERIGHGTSAIQDPDLLEYLRDRQIPIEICLTSNLFTGKYVRRPQDHPVRRYYDMGIICSINTDDPEIFNVDLTQEYYKLYKYLNFSITEIIDLIRMGVDSTFKNNKFLMWKSFEKEIKHLREEYQL